MGQIQQVYGFLKETVIAIMIFYKNRNEMLYLSDSDTDFFDIPSKYILIICQDYVLQASTDKTSFIIKTKEVDDIQQKTLII